MTTNQTICDLCTQTIPTEAAVEARFGTLALSGPGRELTRWLTGPGSSQLDICPECARSLADWLGARKSASAAPQPAAIALDSATEAAATAAELSEPSI